MRQWLYSLLFVGALCLPLTSWGSNLADLKQELTEQIASHFFDEDFEESKLLAIVELAKQIEMGLLEIEAEGRNLSLTEYIQSDESIAVLLLRLEEILERVDQMTPTEGMVEFVRAGARLEIYYESNLDLSFDTELLLARELLGDLFFALPE